MIIATVVLLFTLLCMLLAGDREWANVTRPERNDLVFAGRHRDYGAYVLRREYDRRVIIAITAAFGLLGLGILGVKLLVHGEVMEAPPSTREIIVELEKIFDPPPPLVETTVPTPPSGGTATPSLVTLLVLDTARFDEKDTASVAPPGPPADTLAPGGGGKGPGGEGPPGGGDGGTPLGTGIYTEVTIQERPSFPGGESAMFDWLKRNIRYPDRMADAGEEDKVYVEFVIEADGSVSMVKAVKGRHTLSKEEAARVVSRFPKWSPGRMNGHAVRCRLTLPVSFRLK
jgi:protein TonB